MGMLASGIRATVPCAALQPVVLLVTVIVNMPLPVAIGFAIVSSDNAPVPGDSHAKETFVDGVAVALMVAVGLAQVVL